MTNNHPYYKRRPISSVSALARALSCPERELINLITTSGICYSIADRIKKADGSIRVVYSVRDPLRTIQDRILDRILRQVSYPGYMTGGVRDPDNPRDYIRSAQLHCACRVLMGEDIKQFFPSVTTGHVSRIFKHLFHFPPPVAGALATLCTYQGELPQGAPPSSYLANLVLFDVEPSVVTEFQRRGLVYGRHIDDVNVSSPHPLSASEKQFVIETIQRMLRRRGFCPKRTKQYLTNSGTAMQVHGLNVNHQKPTITRVVRSNVRARIFKLEKRFALPTRPDSLKKELNSSAGQAHRIRKLHQGEGGKLVERINRLRARLV